MAEQRPLILIAGRATILPAGDTLPSSGGVSDGDKGDVTVSSSGTVWRVDPPVKYGLPIALAQRAFFN